MSAVVVVAGKAARKVGWKRRKFGVARVFVEFPGEEFPADFRLIHVNNLRPATIGELAKLEAA